MKKLRRPSAQKGIAAVEFGLLLIVLLLVAAGIVEFGRAFWYYNALTKATRDGARQMSLAAKASIASAGIPAARTLVVNAANGANLYPQLASGQVSVTCTPACADGTAPEYVSVQINGYAIDIGGLFPFFPVGGAGSTRYVGVTLAPHTTMRYMN